VATKATCCPVTVSTLPKENPRQDFKKSEKKFLSPNIASFCEFAFLLLGRTANCGHQGHVLSRYWLQDVFSEKVAGLSEINRRVVEKAT
jgi:hypothetical protein